jgi:protein involved in polysaccharide export with SLBB domain
MLLAAILCACGPGCATLDTPSPTAPQPTALSWLTNWVSQPIEMAPGFDVDTIKPSPAPLTVAPQNVLEVTVWDLYEPGKPYSYPVRVTDEFKIEVPMLGEVDVENRTIAQVESALVESLRSGEYLLHPRVVVRSLDAPMIKVQVTGAVNRPGYVELTTADRSAYAAIMSAGGLNKMAGTQVAVTRPALAASPERSVMPRIDPSVERPAEESDDRPAESVENSEPASEPEEPRVPVQRANTVEDLSVSPGPPTVRSAPEKRGMFSVSDEGVSGAVDPPAGKFEYGTPDKAPLSSKPDKSRGSGRPVQKNEPATVWYDVSQPRERDQLKAIVLLEGDVVTVKTAAQPLRIGGIVNRPGMYPLPPGRNLNVWQAIDLAGGVRDEKVPLNITLVRPAAEGRGARRKFLSVAAYEEHPAASPQVEPGDELHVEPTTGSKIKRVVRDVWSKP